jgi:hypothetical protein
LAITERWTRRKLAGSWVVQAVQASGVQQAAAAHHPQLDIVVGPDHGQDLGDRRQLDASRRGHGQAVGAAGGAGQGGLAAAVVAAQAHHLDHQQRQHQAGGEQEVGKVGQPFGEGESQGQEQRQIGQGQPRAGEAPTHARRGRQDGERHPDDQRPGRLDVEPRKQGRGADHAKGQTDHQAARLGQEPRGDIGHQQD